jgi:hypothetical protein
MISAHVVLIPKSGQEAEFIVETYASKVGIAGVLLQEDFEGNLQPCAYWARKLKDTKTRYIAYDKEALAIVEAVSRFGGCIYSVVNASHWSQTMQFLSIYSRSQVINCQIGNLIGSRN